MPAKSAKQYRLMAGIAHGMKTSIGPSVEVAKEFVKKTSKKARKLFMRKEDHGLPNNITGRRG